MINQETARFIEQIQYFTIMMFYALVISMLSAGLAGGLRDLDHPGHKQVVWALANALIVAMLFMWWGGSRLR